VGIIRFPKAGIKVGRSICRLNSGTNSGIGSDSMQTRIAELLGRAGTAMLHKHYSHLSARTDTLRSALANVR
jgi:hypothetical protein